MRGPWDWGAERSAARRERLRLGVESTLGHPSDAAIAAFRGPRPGLEVLGILAVAVAPTPASPWLAALSGGVVVLAAICALIVWRQHVVLAVTAPQGPDTQIALLASTRRHPTIPDRLIGEYPAAEATFDLPIGRTGSVRLAGRRYWVVGADADDARRIARSLASPAA